jgi:hypothetical protein
LDEKSPTLEKFAVRAPKLASQWDVPIREPESTEAMVAATA